MKKIKNKKSQKFKKQFNSTRTNLSLGELIFSLLSEGLSVRLSSNNKGEGCLAGETRGGEEALTEFSGELGAEIGVTERSVDEMGLGEERVGEGKGEEPEEPSAILEKYLQPPHF